MPKPFVHRSDILCFATAAFFLGCGQSPGSAGTDAGAAGAIAAASAGAGALPASGSGSGGAAGGVSAGLAGGSGAGGRDSGSDVIAVQDCAIAAPTHWSAGVYLANCKIEVQASLTIDPGAIIKFGPGFYLDVLAGGTLTAIGSDSLPIVFTSVKDDAHGGDTNRDGPSAAAVNDWGCQGACGDLNIRGNGSVLENVHALYGSNGVYVQAESTRVSKCTFAHHATYGLVLDGSFSVETTQITENVFFDNRGYPLHLGKAVFVDASNTFHDPANPEAKNGKQCIEVATDLDRLVALGVTEVGFLFSGHRISAEVLTPPGVIFKARDAAIYLDAAGSLYNGPNAIFTSSEDDSLGGDCTGDGPSTPTVGDWEGLWIDDGSNADYAAPVDYVRYAAKSGTGSLH